MENPTARRWSNLKRIGGNDCVGESEQIEKQRSRSRERKTDLRQEFEGRAWRTPGEQIITRSARSSRHGFREESSIHDGRTRRGKGVIDKLWTPRIPLYRFLRLCFLVFEFCFASRRWIKLIPGSFICDSKFFKVNLNYWTINIKIHLRCRNCISWD